MNDKYKSSYGMWRVTTEGDCEGRSVKELGVYKGYIDDIAFALADRCCYDLEFTPFEFAEIPVPDKRVDRVRVALGVDSGTWSMKMPERKAFFETILTGRDVCVGDSGGYASIVLYRNSEISDDEQRKAVLKKLTDKEKQLLGLI